MTEEILAHMARSHLAWTAQELAEAVGEPLQAVTATLHQLDDAGRVIMKCGWYRLSEAERKRMEKEE